MLQYNLSQILSVAKFRYAGSVSSSTDYDQLLADFFTSPGCLAATNILGSPTIPTQITADNLGVGVMSMEFFDRFEEAGEIFHFVDFNI